MPATEREGRRPDLARPSSAELRAAAGRAIPDVLAPGLRVLFVGINPGLYSGATGLHFARPGNRFWPTIFRAGFTPRLLRPDDTDELLALGIGITNIVNRTTATAAELAVDELVAGGAALRVSVERDRPAAVGILGVTAYRTAFRRPDATIGRQAARIGPAVLWVLPNPSGLNAHYQLPALVQLFRQFGEDIGYVTVPRSRRPARP